MRTDSDMISIVYRGTILVMVRTKLHLQKLQQNGESDPKSEMYKLPSMHVGAYAERDAEVTLGLWQEMKKEIINQDLEDIFDLESDLFPCLVDMRFKGVRVDVERAHNMKKEFKKAEQESTT